MFSPNGLFETLKYTSPVVIIVRSSNFGSWFLYTSWTCWGRIDLTWQRFLESSYNG